MFNIFTKFINIVCIQSNNAIKTDEIVKVIYTIIIENMYMYLTQNGMYSVHNLVIPGKSEQGQVLVNRNSKPTTPQ